MSHGTIRVLTAVALILLPSASADAQAKTSAMKSGRWTGTITPPNKAAIAVAYDVTVHGDSIAIVIDGPAPIGRVFTNNVKLLNDVLTLEWTAGSTWLKCTLRRGEKTEWAGECADADGVTGKMTLVEPVQPR